MYCEAVGTTVSFTSIEAPTLPDAVELYINEANVIKYVPGSLSVIVDGEVKVIEVPTELTNSPKSTRPLGATAT